MTPETQLLSEFLSHLDRTLYLGRRVTREYSANDKRFAEGSAFAQALRNLTIKDGLRSIAEDRIRSISMRPAEIVAPRPGAKTPRIVLGIIENEILEFLAKRRCFTPMAVIVDRILKPGYTRSAIEGRVRYLASPEVGCLESGHASDQGRKGQYRFVKMKLVP